MLTATFGGILRDMLAGEPSVLLRPEIYVTAAMAGAAAFTFLYIARVPEPAVDDRRLPGRLRRARWRAPLRLDLSALSSSRPGRRPEDIP